MIVVQAPLPRDDEGSVMADEDKQVASLLAEIIGSDPELENLPWWAYTLVEPKPEDQCVY